VQVGAVHRLADLAFVAVGRGGVDVAVSGSECGPDGVAGLVRRRLEDAEAERGHLDSVVEGDRLHVVDLSVDAGGEAGVWRRQAWVRTVRPSHSLTAASASLTCQLGTSESPTHAAVRSSVRRCRGSLRGPWWTLTVVRP